MPVYGKQADLAYLPEGSDCHGPAMAAEPAGRRGQGSSGKNCCGPYFRIIVEAWSGGRFL